MCNLYKKKHFEFIHRALTIRVIFIILPVTLLQACSSLQRNPVPLNISHQATVLDIPKARTWRGKNNTDFEKDLINAFSNTKGNIKIILHKSKVKTQVVNILAVSGGGDDGAFGAGILNGWTKTGRRPEFKIVTGISTGALIAPFAFLGPEYDSTLKEYYTSIDAEDIYKKRGISALWKDSLVDSSPLANLIKKLITIDVIRKIASEYRKGRRLYIGTTHIDIDRLVMWNMGAIANSKHPDATTLFRQILLASSSVPVIYPPVMINVNINGKKYDEMHVDGGVKAQFFLPASIVDIVKASSEVKTNLNILIKPKVYVIRNSKFVLEPKIIKRKLAAISQRSMSSFIQSHGLKDLAASYHFGKRHGVDIHWIAIPQKYRKFSSSSFDSMEMGKLFNIGYKMGSDKSVWQKGKPSFN